MNQLFLLKKIAQNEKQLSERWFYPTVVTPTKTYTKLDIYNYYKSVKDKLFKDIKDNPVIIVRHFGPESPVLQRNLPTGSKIYITKNRNDVFDKNDINFWIERRTTEFHKTQSDKTDKLIVDIDPNGPVSKELINKTVSNVYTIIKNIPGVQSVELRYSGGRGFYVIGHLAYKSDINKLREMLKRELAPLESKYVTLSVPYKGQIRLDLSPMKRGGSIRALFSLNTDTGLVSIPLKLYQLKIFNPLIHAAMENFIRKVRLPIRL